MSEISFQGRFAVPVGLVTFCMALSALVVACLSYVQVQKNTVTLSQQVSPSDIRLQSPTILHGVWQVCGQVDAISKYVE